MQIIVDCGWLILNSASCSQPTHIRLDLVTLYPKARYIIFKHCPVANSFLVWSSWWPSIDSGKQNASKFIVITWLALNILSRDLAAHIPSFELLAALVTTIRRLGLTFYRQSFCAIWRKQSVGNVIMCQMAQTVAKELLEEVSFFKQINTVHLPLQFSTQRLCFT